jgi:serine/threonine protein phosphatase PrpC
MDSITNAHLAILGYAERCNLPETPRTTIVACVIQEGIAFWAHVGDSRLYLIRDGHVEAVTKDHSRVQQLVDIGRVREEAASNHPDRNKVYNCLGQLSLPRVDLSRRTPLRSHDALILCTDGLWGAVSSRTIVEAVLRDDIIRTMPDLLATAESRAGADGDNLSAIGLTWLGEDALDPLVPRSISTKTMQMSDVATQTAGFADKPQEDFLSDDEIERAIEEIRGAIRDGKG